MEAADLIQVLTPQQTRRLRVIENLLRGKKTVSTLYWGQRYQLLPLIGLDKSLDRGGLDAAARSLVTGGLATLDEENDQLRLTPTGVIAAQRTYYQPQTADTWIQLDLMAARQRLLVAVQVVSEYTHATRRYYPLATDLATRQAVRAWFQREKSDRLGQQILQALTHALEQLPETVAMVTTSLLTGYQHPGLTREQVAQRQQRTAWEVTLMQLDGLMQICQDARVAQTPFTSLLSSLWQSPVTRSAQLTLEAVRQTGDLDQVATQRRIKLSTVREHLLEAAIFLPLVDFPYEQILTPKLCQLFAKNLTGAIDDWQYTSLPADLQARYDFFYFRLYAIWIEKGGVLSDGVNNES